MENLTLISSPKIPFGYTSNLNGVISIRHSYSISLFHLSRKPIKTRSFRVSAHANQGNGEDRVHLPRRVSRNGMEAFASISSSSSRETSSSVGVNPPLSVPPPPSQMGSPLFWIGIGVGLSALFTVVATNLKKYAMQQAMKTMMGQMAAGNNQGSSAFSTGSPFPFPPIQTTSTPGASPFVASPPGVTVDVSATNVEAAPATNAKDITEVKKETKKYAFVDIGPDELVQKVPYESPKEPVKTSSTENAQLTEATQNGAAAKQDKGAYNETSQSSRKPGAPLSVETLEKMMEDPTVQKMVYPHLPEEMRNPTTFKWMLQNPVYRKQLEDMLNNMGGNSEWDNQMMNSLKNFDLSSPEVKQQFGEIKLPVSLCPHESAPAVLVGHESASSHELSDQGTFMEHKQMDQIGLTPEEVISKIMSNPEVAMAFQNPKIQAAIMDVSQNPLSIAKYQNDMEVMTVFNKLTELFPGVSGSGSPF